jgi:hypothetical protein
MPTIEAVGRIFECEQMALSPKVKRPLQLRSFFEANSQCGLNLERKAVCVCVERVRDEKLTVSRRRRRCKSSLILFRLVWCELGSMPGLGIKMSRTKGSGGGKKNKGRSRGHGLS